MNKMEKKHTARGKDEAARTKPSGTQTSPDTGAETMADLKVS